MAADGPIGPGLRRAPRAPPGRCRGVAGQAELAQDVGQVPVDGVLAQHEPPGDVGAAQFCATPGQRRPLGAGQQLPGPVDHGSQGLLPRQRCPRPASQQREPLIQPGLQLGHRHRSQPRRGQLQGQRDAIKPSADLPHHRRGGRLICGESHSVSRGTVCQQPHRLTAPDRSRLNAVERSIDGTRYTRSPSILSGSSGSTGIDDAFASAWASGIGAEIMGGASSARTTDRGRTRSGTDGGETIRRSTPRSLS
jgi:hypothetical protein